ncbi:PREDICTED: trypsin-1-like [Ceratosolen solmsi marchali]|uniref:Trypsin-1-like n=1 Tax=Ceratosolen solmsi marchali TaxID=326594 RepID=A0AAJ6YVL2_9HYME|nr:PREDICTED: trypsin-1-like [Ceratosolen solmsi marchali]
MIGLPTKDINNGDIAILSGWGLTTYPYSGSSDHLQKISIPILKHYECSRYYPFSIEKEQFCTYNERGIGACHGDSGSPLVHNEVLVGISSFIIPCAQEE